MANKDRSNRAAFPFSNAVLRDLLDHDLDSIEVANRHDLDPAAVRDAVRSEAFRRAAEALREADLARTELIWPSMHARALHGLARIANQPTTTAAQTESARRAYTALLKAGRHPVPTRAEREAKPTLAKRSADIQATPLAQTEPPAPAPNPLADVTADPTMTLEDPLRLIAEIEAARRGPARPGCATGGTPAPPDLNATPTHKLPTLPRTPPTPAAQLLARAGAAP